MSRLSFKSGFTLVEMIVVVGIFLAMTSVVLANLPSFRDHASLDLVAQEVALVVRQAQSFGINTRAYSSGGIAQFPSYGLYFNLTNNAGVAKSKTSFILFADKVPTDNKYVEGDNCGGTNTECRERFNLEGGLQIDSIQSCATTCVATVDPINIIFHRPNPEADFRDINGAGVTCGGGPCSYVKITLRSVRQNTTRDICIWSTGHVYTKLTCP